MNVNDAEPPVVFKVGVFAVLGMMLVGALTVFVNDRPYWWRPCDIHYINIDDATGLKTKSPVSSLGIQIGYIKSVQLTETYVRLGICITANVDILPSTRAHVSGQGILGDKVVELKPVRYLGTEKSVNLLPAWAGGLAQLVFPAATALAQEGQEGREIPMAESSRDVQHIVNKVDGLVGELTTLTTTLKESINPDQLRNTVVQLNRALENAAKTLSPQGGLTATAQRVLAKLESAVEQLRDQMTRINQGKGSVGRMLNDPVYAEELEKAIKNINKLLGRASEIRFLVSLSAHRLTAHDGTRGHFGLEIWPSSSRYYSLGVATDPRGRFVSNKTTTTVDGVSQTVQTDQIERSGILLTAMLGKVFWKRLDVAAGIRYGDGTASININLGPATAVNRLRLETDIYARNTGFGSGTQLNSRIRAVVYPLPMDDFSPLFVSGGIEGIRKVNGKMSYSVGAGIKFDDEDIKLLFTFL